MANEYLVMNENTAIKKTVAKTRNLQVID